jgi:hypothetical protein
MCLPRLHGLEGTLTDDHRAICMLCRHTIQDRQLADVLGDVQVSAATHAVRHSCWSWKLRRKNDPVR